MVNEAQRHYLLCNNSVVCAVNGHQGHVETHYAFVQLCNTWDVFVIDSSKLCCSHLWICVLLHRPLKFTYNLYEKHTQDWDRIYCNLVAWIAVKLYIVSVQPKPVAHINESYLICDSPFFCLEHPVSTFHCSAVVEQILGTDSFIVC